MLGQRAATRGFPQAYTRKVLGPASIRSRRRQIQISGEAEQLTTEAIEEDGM